MAWFVCHFCTTAAPQAVLLDAGNNLVGTSVAAGRITPLVRGASTAAAGASDKPVASVALPGVAATVVNPTCAQCGNTRALSFPDPVFQPVAGNQKPVPLAAAGGTPAGS